MKFLTLLLCATVLVLYAHCSVAAVPYEQLYAKTIELGEFKNIDANTIPEIKIVPGSVIYEIMCRGKPCDVEAAYLEGAVYVKEGLDDGVYTDSVIVHEFVHHLQWVQYDERLIPFLIKRSLYLHLSCEAKRSLEYHAYRIQALYARSPVRGQPSIHLYRALRERLRNINYYSCRDKK